MRGSKKTSLGKLPEGKAKTGVGKSPKHKGNVPIGFATTAGKKTVDGNFVLPQSPSHSTSSPERSREVSVPPSLTLTPIPQIVAQYAGKSNPPKSAVPSKGVNKKIVEVSRKK